MTPTFEKLLRQWEDRMESVYGQPEEDEIDPELDYGFDYEEDYWERKERGLWP